MSMSQFDKRMVLSWGVEPGCTITALPMAPKGLQPARRTELDRTHDCLAAPVSGRGPRPLIVEREDIIFLNTYSTQG